MAIAKHSSDARRVSPTHTSFDFLSATAKPECLGGTVIVRDAEMVLEIEYPGEDPYNIVGRRQGSCYRGRHVASPGDIEVEASWAEVGNGNYVGLWIEDGSEWLFQFHLPA
jgi:hypothetical protein